MGLHTHKLNPRPALLCLVLVSNDRNLRSEVRALECLEQGLDCIDPYIQKKRGR